MGRTASNTSAIWTTTAKKMTTAMILVPSPERIRLMNRARRRTRRTISEDVWTRIIEQELYDLTEKQLARVRVIVERNMAVCDTPQRDVKPKESK